MRPLFFGKIENGNLKLDEADIFRGYILSFEGKEIQLTIEKKSKNVTIPQMRYYRGVLVPMVAKEMGDTHEETHDFLTSMFLKDYKELNGKRYTIIRSTTELNTIEFTEFIENVKRFSAIELHLVLPDARKRAL